MNRHQLRIHLHSLVLFRGLLQNNVMQKLDTLLQVDSTNTCAVADAYSSFVAALLRHGDCLSDYLLRAVLDDENIYVLAKCTDAPISSTMETCLFAELSFLQQLALYDGASLRKRMGDACFLPLWRTKEYDFTTIYKERMANLPREGYGIFAKHHVFTVQDAKLVPVKHPDPQSMNTLYGYERERNLVLANTRALLEGRPASNVLLYGDAGTGKSSSVKAVANALYHEGLRLIEVKKNQLYQIPDLVNGLSKNPLKFILFIDDLSFASNDNDFAALKAILEGSVSGHSGNLVVYATSNRRHLVKESFSDREGDEVHHGDTMQELMSLSARFGLKITFSRPDKDLYCDIVEELATLYGIDLPAETLHVRAEAHAIRNGGRSPRVAKQFIEQLKAEM